MSVNPVLQILFQPQLTKGEIMQLLERAEKSKGDLMHGSAKTQGYPARGICLHRSLDTKQPPTEVQGRVVPARESFSNCPLRRELFPGIALTHR